MAATGEPYGLLKPGELESALYSPQNAYYHGGEEDILVLASTLMLSIARNHPFEQGNKRTGFVAGVMLLELNGYTLSADYTGVAHEFVAVIAHKLDEEEFTDALYDLLEPIGACNG